MDTAEIKAAIEAIATQPSLYTEANFASRAEALDELEFHVIDRLDGLLETADAPPALLALKEQAEQLKLQLEATDSRLFQQLRAAIQAGHCTGPSLWRLLAQYLGPNLGCPNPAPATGYDSLDTFLNGILPEQPLPLETQAREPEMVYYQKTPARIILELARKITSQDTFYDIGSGLGQVPIWVHLLSGATAKGIEIEPAYCQYAQACATTLHLPQVQFLNVDARTADYADGSAFFLYTPFTGSILQQVLHQLREVSQRRAIRVFTYGPCALAVAAQPWLHRQSSLDIHVYQLVEFRSQ